MTINLFGNMADAAGGAMLAHAIGQQADALQDARQACAEWQRHSNRLGSRVMLLEAELQQSRAELQMLRAAHQSDRNEIVAGIERMHAGAQEIARMSEQQFQKDQAFIQALIAQLDLTERQLRNTSSALAGLSAMAGALSDVALEPSKAQALVEASTQSADAFYETGRLSIDDAIEAELVQARQRTLAARD